MDDARRKAREWLALLQRGVDPKAHEARLKAEALRRQRATFAHVAEEFLTRHVAKLAHSNPARRIITAEFTKRWGPRPAADVLPEECAAAIRAIVQRGAPAQAHTAHDWLRRMFTWAIGTNEFGLTASPLERLRPTDLIGRKVVRLRVLTDAELRAVSHAGGGRVDAACLAEARRRDVKRDFPRATVERDTS